MRHQLADNYRAERDQLIALGRTLDDDAAAQMTSACPAWSIKDVYAHLAGISTDILAGNTENAATVEWADGHVADRLGRSVTEVLDEWESAGAEVSNVMEVAGQAFPFQLFVDQWTHGWDIRATIGDDAAQVPDLAVYQHYLTEFFAITSGDLAETETDLATLTVSVDDETFELGNAGAAGTLPLSLFEYARISMGRRSRAQLNALPWPQAIADPAPYIDVLVRWSVNSQDVVDPVLTQ